MMHETVLLPGRIVMLAVISALVPAARTEQLVRADIHRLLATPYPVDDQGVASFKLKFDVRLANMSQQVLSLLLGRVSDAEAARPG